MSATRLPINALILVLVALAGCGKSGPQVAPVQGRVTLDGRPLAFAEVAFQPDGGKRASMGRTDEEGRYELAYKRGQPGAIVGPHTVRIWVSAEFVKNPPVIAARFDTKSELRREVKANDNEFNFDVTTEGK
jgi:predicted small lipoprotein YifL